MGQAKKARHWLMPLLLMVLYLTWGTFAQAWEQQSPLDLSKANFNAGTIKLSGPWEFYWETLLKPGEALPNEPTIVQAGYTWKGMTLGDGRKLDAKGYATYRLRFTGLPADEQTFYEIGLSWAGSINRMILFREDQPKEVVWQTGADVASLYKSPAFDRTVYNLTFVPHANATYVLLIQVANQMTDWPGLMSIPLLGKSPQVATQFKIEGFVNVMTCGVLIAIGVYSFMMWFRRRQDRAALCLAGIAVMALLRLIAMTPAIRCLIPVFWHDTFHRIEYFVMVVGPLLYLPFLNDTFFSVTVPRWMVPMLGASALLGSMALIGPIMTFTSFLIVYQMLLLVFATAYLVLIAKAIARKKPHAWMVLIGCCLIITGFVIDVLENRGFIASNVETTPIAVAIFAILQSQVIAKRAAEAFTKAERYAQELTKKEQERTQFFHNVSHELRTPLNGIIGFVDLLTGPRAEPMHDVARNQVAKIGNLAKDLKQQINTILDLAKSKKGQLQVLNSNFDLNELVEQCSCLTDGLRVKYKNCSFELKVSWPMESHPHFVNDAAKIMTIARNLLGNAFKFGVSERQNHIELWFVHENSTLSIKVKDTGIGIPEDMQEPIFHEFGQVQSDARRAYEGTGLGLAMVKNLVNLLGGKIDLTSRPGEGTTFTVTIPEQSVIHTAAEIPREEVALDITNQNRSVGFGQPPGRERPQAVEAKNLHILIIDDIETNCEVIESILKNEGYTTSVAYSGRDGLAKMKASSPDLVLLDLMMPEVSGEDVLKEMSSDETLKGIPVIILTARASQEDRIYGLELGADDYIAKPVISRDLVLRTQNLLTRVKLTRQAESTQYKVKLFQAAKLASLGEMAGNIAHEIMNPVAIIHGKSACLETILRSDNSGTDNKSLGMVTTIQKAVGRIETIIHSMRAIALQDGKKEQFLTVSAKSFIQDTLLLYTERMKNKGVQLILGDLDDELLACRPPEVAQVLVNLINNALDAVEYESQKWIKIAVTKSKQWVDIEVSNSGKSIEDKTVQRLFEPFFSTKGVGKGIGLGLSISKALAQEHRGDLFLDRSSPHTRFVVRLPKLPGHTTVGKKSA